MENQKDNGINNQENQRPIAGMTVFDSRAHFAFVHKKTEKLVAAVYVVSNFVKDNEPLKWSIREKALELLELSAMLNFVSLEERRQVLRDHQSVITEIVSIAGVARHGGLFSEMNHGIIVKEFEALSKTIEESEKKQDSSIFGSDFFETKSLLERPASPDVSYNQSPASLSFTGDRKIQKDNKKIPTPKSPIVQQVKKNESVSEVKKDSDRRGLIIGMLKKKGGLGIKDFVDVISGVSAKTIQRELLSMVALGQIRKEGDRRWSRYFIAE